jgi:hypothetical protein
MKMQFRLWIESDHAFHSSRELAEKISLFLQKTKVTPGHHVEADGPKGIKFYPTSLPKEAVPKAINAIKYIMGEMGVAFKELGWERPLEDDRDYDHYRFTVDMPHYEKPDYSRLRNPELRKRLVSGEVLDVRQMGVEEEPGVFRLNNFVDGHDYADSETEAWIWSIGRHKNTGEIFAAYDGRYYNPNDEDFEYETLFVR